VEHLETENTKEKDKELIEKIRSKFEEVEELIEGMKSRLPEKIKK